MTVKLVACLTNGEATAVLEEDLDFVVGKVVGAVVQLASADDILGHPLLPFVDNGARIEMEDLGEVFVDLVAQTLNHFVGERFVADLDGDKISAEQSRAEIVEHHIAVFFFQTHIQVVVVEAHKVVKDV